MSVKINREKCNNCKNAKEPICAYICPGDLFVKNQHNTVVIRDVRDCWDCAACVKSCPQQAIEMYLPVQVGGKGAKLTGKKSGNELLWQCTWPSGSVEKFKVRIEKR